MLGIEDYGSDDEVDNEAQETQSTAGTTSSLLAKLPPPTKKSSFSLPPPTNASASALKPSNGLNLPAPKAKAKKAPKKITIGLPALPADGSKDEDVDDRPPAKKPRLEAGAGRSALLSMLPAPKNITPAAPERVLGGGRGPGLVFQTAPSRPQAVTVENADDEDDEVPDRHADSLPSTSERILEEKPASIPFLPPSLVKGRANISVEDRHELPKSARSTVSSAPAVDFFSLGSSGNTPSSSTKPTLPKPSITSTPSSSSAPSSSTIPPSILTGISSAPKVEEFNPPEPTPEDPYPGYYLLPNGSWAAYDPAYYKTFYDKWKREYDAHVRALEKGKVKGFEGADEEGMEEVNALKEMEKAKIEIQEREERKELTKGAAAAAAAPNMNIKGAMGGRARSRHQLSSLLTEAYMNREALEERIAQGRKNRKEAGNKYGF